MYDKKVTHDGIIYSIDKKIYNAVVSGTKNPPNDVIIPADIKKGFTKYCVRSIGKRAFEDNKCIRSLSFDTDSCVSEICHNAFYCSGITVLKLPARIQRLDANWCSYTMNLNSVFVPANNEYFMNIKNNLLIDKKTNSVLFYPRKEMGTVIPNNITKINNHAFGYSKANFVHFQENSIITSIGDCAFFRCINQFV